MQNTRQHALIIFVAAALMSLAGVAATIDETRPLTGTVVSVNRDLNYITIRDDVTGRNFKIDTRSMNGRRSIDVWNLRAGDRVRATGAWANSETYRADRVMFANAQPGGLANGLTGTVDSLNRDLNYITVRDQATGQITKVDVRNIDTRRSVNVWQLRNGDLVTAYGRPSKNGTFRADFVNFGDSTPMSSGSISPNVLTGIVDSVNRELNYFILRDDGSGQPVKIDVRDMDTRRSVNVWNLRAGDRITVNGSWTADHDRFQAEMVKF